ncbi:MAG: hypothetical protein NTZ80_04105, partial [Patescibacteria group bacterium]|nr:hypothetical protein [Patescibacteria group bacterium]
MINYNDIVKKLKEIFKKAGLGEATFDICAKNGRPKLTYFFIGDELLKVKEQIEKEFLINLENYYLKKATLGSLARHLYRVMMSNEKMEEPPPRKKIVKTLVSIFKIILEVRGNEIDTGKKLRDYA